MKMKGDTKMATTKTSTTAASELASGAAQFLTPVVIDLEALVVNGKQAHWHTRGGSFIGIHELLDSVVTHAQDHADSAAERVVALGLPLDARLRTVAEKSTLPPLSDGFQPWQTTVTEVVANACASVSGFRMDWVSFGGV